MVADVIGVGFVGGVAVGVCVVVVVRRGDFAVVGVVVDGIGVAVVWYGARIVGVFVVNVGGVGVVLSISIVVGVVVVAVCDVVGMFGDVDVGVVIGVGDVRVDAIADSVGVWWWWCCGCCN